MSILDLYGVNLMSRLLKSKSDTLPEALDKLRKDIKRDYFKPSIKSLKKKGSKGKKKQAGPSFELVLADDDPNVIKDE